MSLFTPVGNVSNIARQLQPKDIPLASNNSATSAATTNPLPWTPAQITSGIFSRTGALGAGSADTMPTAADLMAFLTENGKIVQQGFSFALKFRNAGTGQTITITTNTGVTLSGTVAVATNTTRDMIITLDSTMLPQVLQGATANTTTVLQFPTGGAAGSTVADLSKVQIGSLVTGTGIGASAKVIGVNAAKGTVEVSVASTATASNVAITFSPAYSVFAHSGGTI